MIQVKKVNLLMPLRWQQNDAAVFFAKKARSSVQPNVAWDRLKLCLIRTTEKFCSGLTWFTFSVRENTPLRMKRCKQTSLLIKDLWFFLHIYLGHYPSRELECCHSESLKINLFGSTKNTVCNDFDKCFNSMVILHSCYI